jgi:hypothetical protein
MVALVESTAEGVDQHKKLASEAGRRTSRPCSSATPQAEATDKQIDALVYEFYGLSDDEIAVVEG